MRAPLIAAALSILLPAAALAAEQPVAPYVQSNANAGGTPMKDDAVYRAFHGKEGIARVVAGTIARETHDPRIADIFKAQDLERLQRVLTEQICYLLGGPCTYTGRDMRTTHKDLGIQISDQNALVEDLQKSMDAEGVPFRAQNKLLAKLVRMRHDVVRR
jgi:hemoglobin